MMMIGLFGGGGGCSGGFLCRGGGCRRGVATCWGTSCHSRRLMLYCAGRDRIVLLLITCSGDAMDDNGSMDCLGCENNEPSMKFMILRCKRDVMLLLHVLYIVAKCHL